jgi:hypothetical protein
LAVALTACGGSAGDVGDGEGSGVAPPGPIDAAPGETVERDGVTITVFEAGAARSFDRREQAAEGKVFIAARLSIHNSASQVPAQGPEALELELPDGTVGRPWIVTPGSRLRDTGPGPGEEFDGWRSWEVPEGTRAATLSYRPHPGVEIRFGFTLSGEVRDRWQVTSDLRHV